MTSYNVTVSLGGQTARDTGVYNVIDYSATGDGVTDDTASIQAAVDAAISAGGGNVHLPNGTYMASEIEVDGDNVSITALPGAVMKSNVSGTIGTPAHLINVTGDNFSAKNLRIDMTDEAGTYDYGIYCNGVTGALIDSCVITGSGYSIALRGSSEAIVSNNRCSGFKEYGIIVWGNSDGITINDNPCFDTTGSVTANGIKLAGETGATTSTEINNVIISGNNCWNVKHGIDAAINSGYNIAIVGNTIYDCTEYGIVLKFNSKTYSGSEAGIINGVISSNSLHGCALGIDVQRGDGQPVLQGVSVCDNVLTGPGVLSGGDGVAIRIYGCLDTLVTGNLASTWRRGILVADSDDTIVKGNAAVKCYRPMEVATQVAALTCSGTIISNNVFKSATTTDTSADESPIFISDDTISDGGPTDTLILRNHLAAEGSVVMITDDGTDTDIQWSSDAFAPEGTISAGIGSLFIDTTGGRSTTGFIKESGSGTTGWSAITTAYNTTVTEGMGSPEGVITGRVGSIFRRTDGGAGTTLYVKESGASNTGWVAK